MQYLITTPAEEADIFEAEAQASRRVPRAAPQPPQPSLRSFSLILARCESAATLLGWRKQVSPDQKQALECAIERLKEVLARVPVVAPLPQKPQKRDMRVPFFPRFRS